MDFEKNCPKQVILFIPKAIIHSFIDFAYIFVVYIYWTVYNKVYMYTVASRFRRIYIKFWKEKDADFFTFDKTDEYPLSRVNWEFEFLLHVCFSAKTKSKFMVEFLQPNL